MGQSAFGREYDVSTPGGAILALPVGLTYLLFAPFPWAIAGTRQALVLPEMLVWYGLMPAFVAGLIQTIRRQLGDVLPILTFAVTLTLAYALMQGNVGTAYRQRTQVTMFFFLFMGVGLVERAKQKALRTGRQVITARAADDDESGDRRFRLAGLALVALLPNALKKPLYRTVFGYRLGPGVRIGLTLLDAEQVDLGEGTRIGHLNVIVRVGTVPDRAPGAHRHAQRHPRRRARVARRLRRRHAPERAERHPRPRLHDRAAVGVGGRRGHGDHVRSPHRLHGPGNARQERHHRRTELVALDPQPAGNGSDPWSATSAIWAARCGWLRGRRCRTECILGIGAVLTGEINEPRSLVAGVPARVVRPLDEKDLARIRRKTRGDMPDDFYERS